MTAPTTKVGTAPPPQMPSLKVQLVDSHYPDIMSGNYLIEATQSVGSTEDGRKSIRRNMEGHKVTLLDGVPIKDMPTEAGARLIINRVDGSLYFRSIFEFDSTNPNAPHYFDTPLNALTDRSLAEITPVVKLLDDHWERWSKTISLREEKDLVKKISKLIGYSFHQTRSFSVGAERYSLNPVDILSVFPPNGNRGDHSNVLPHVILKRSTLPWERFAQTPEGGDRSPIPWMGILVFDDTKEAPAPKVKTINLGDSKDLSDAETLYQDQSISFVERDWQEPEGGERPKDRVQVIDLTRGELEAVLPATRDLPYLAHVRRDVDDNEKLAGQEHAVVIANRLPSRGKDSVAYLVSFENRFVNDEFRFNPVHPAVVGSDLPVRLVVLKSWRFSCPDKQSFAVSSKTIEVLGEETIRKEGKKIKVNQNLIDQIKPMLNHEFVGDSDNFQTKLGITNSKDFDKVLALADNRKLSFKSLLMQLDCDTFRLKPKNLQNSESLNATTVDLLKQSMVAVPHKLRNGELAGSLYHGPFTSGALKKPDIISIAQSPDELLRRETASGLLDASYSAAWELGRLMMLGSKQTALALFNWKRAHASHVKQVATRLSHLPFNRPPADLAMPESVRNWLYETALLVDVPFNYLVPDPAMIEAESIRFFKIDPLWIESLLDGAFSIGRTTRGDIAHEKSLQQKFGIPTRQAKQVKWDQELPTGAVSGAMVRSEAIEGWPHLEVDGQALWTEEVAIANNSRLDLDLDLLSDHHKKGATKALVDTCWNTLVSLGVGMPEIDLCHVEVMETSTNDGKADLWRVFKRDNGVETLVCRISRPKAELHVHLPLLRKAHLSKSLLTCLFHGNVDIVDIHLKPETIHFGVGVPDPKHKDHRYKALREWTGEEREHAFIRKIPMRENAVAGVIDIYKMANGIGGIAQTLSKDTPLAPRDFALQMIEGVDRVRYWRK